MTRAKMKRRELSPAEQVLSSIKEQGYHLAGTTDLPGVTASRLLAIGAITVDGGKYYAGPSFKVTCELILPSSNQSIY